MAKRWSPIEEQTLRMFVLETNSTVTAVKLFTGLYPERSKNAALKKVYEYLRELKTKETSSQDEECNWIDIASENVKLGVDIDTEAVAEVNVEETTVKEVKKTFLGRLWNRLSSWFNG